MDKLSKKIVETGAAAADIFMSIPFLSLIVKSGELTKTVSDTILRLKLKSFLDNLHELSIEEREAFVNDLEKEPEKAQKVSERLVILIGTYNDLDKSKILATVFTSFCRGQMSKSNFFRIGNAITMAFSDDLMDFVTIENSFQNQELLRALIPTGLTVGPSTYVQQLNLNLHLYSVSDLGEILLKAYGREELFKFKESI